MGEISVLEISAYDAGHASVDYFFDISGSFISRGCHACGFLASASAVFRPFGRADTIDAHADMVAVHRGGCFGGWNKDAAEFFEVHSCGFVGGIIGIWVEPGVAGGLETKGADE